MFYKGKYRANVAIDFVMIVNDREHVFNEMKNLVERELTPELERIIRFMFLENDEAYHADVEVEQTQAELWKEEE